jgi:hypothetical protein
MIRPLVFLAVFAARGSRRRDQLRKVLQPLQKRRTAIFFHGTTLREYCEKDHSLGYELLKRMSLVIYRRMRATRNRI